MLFRDLAFPQVNLHVFFSWNHQMGRGIYNNSHGTPTCWGAVTFLPLIPYHDLAPPQLISCRKPPSFSLIMAISDPPKYNSRIMHSLVSAGENYTQRVQV